MIWQDLVFTVGSIFGVFVLAPTLRDSTATVPLGTSAPSALIGLVYGTTFLTMGMTFSALGAFTTGTLWSCIAALRSPTPSVSGLVDRLPDAALDRLPTTAGTDADTSHTNAQAPAGD